MRDLGGILAALAVTSGSLALIQPAGDHVAGAALFEDRCSSCHVAAGGGQGPSLKGVYGRKAGSLAGVNYTAALKASGLVWSSVTLDRFLTDPGKLVPGTAMAVRIPDPRQRRDLISHLTSAR